MSLMNDMLRDLDKRQAPDRSQQVEAQGYGALTQQTPSHGSRTILILLSVIIVMLLMLAMVWWYLQTNNQASTMESGSIQRMAESTVDVVIPAEKSPVITPQVEIKPKPEPKPKQTVVMVKPKPKPVVNDVANPVVNTEVKPETKSLKVKKEEPIVASTVNVSEAQLTPRIEPKAKPIAKAQPKKKISKVVVLSPEQKDEKAANLATKMLQSGESEKASIYLYQFIEQHDVDAQSRAVLVSYLINNRQMSAADQLLNTTDLSQSSHLRRLRAHWYSVSNQPDDAIAVLNSALPEVESDVEYHVLLAALYQQQGYGEESVASYAELIRYDPEIPAWWVGMAIGLDRSEQYSSAAKAYQKALQMEGLRVELADFAKLRLVTLSE